jgi:16S rRNA (uracil1498-N3)-methyltransferase
VLRSAGTPEDVTLLVGPEGDFTPEEGEAALASGFQPVSLGEIILRAETATFFGISALRYEFSGVWGPMV